MGLELEVRPLAVTGLIFHLGQARTPPYLQLQVTEKQVSLAGVAHQGWVCLSILVTLGACPDPPFLPRQVLLRADDGAGEFSTSVTRPSVLCDGQWHRLAGEAPPVPGHSATPTPTLLQRGSQAGLWVGQLLSGLERGLAGDYLASESTFSHSDERRERAPARGGRAEQPHRGPLAGGCGWCPSPSAPRGPAW